MNTLRYQHREQLNQAVNIKRNTEVTPAIISGHVNSRGPSRDGLS